MSSQSSPVIIFPTKVLGKCLSNWNASWIFKIKQSLYPSKYQVAYVNKILREHNNVSGMLQKSI